MPSVIEARNGLRRIAVQARGLLGDTTMTPAAKVARLRELEAEAAQHQDVLAVDARMAGAYGAGADAIGAGELPPDAVAGVAAGRVLPLTIPEADLRQLHEAAISKKSLRIVCKTGADDLVAALPVNMMPVVGRLIEPTRIASIVPATSTDLPVIEYPRITGVTGSAAVVPPGGTKPTVTIDTDLITAHAAKIAALTTVNDESLQDFPNFAALVTAELQKVITEAENAQLLNGSGTGTDMTGLLATSGLLTQAGATGDNNLDVMEKAITALRTGPSYCMATGIVMHPTDWSATRRTKDSYGRYLVAPDPTRDVTESLWGLPVIPTTTCPVGTAVVGNFQIGAALHIRRGLTIELSNQAGTNFENNQTTFRAELRETLAVMRPTAFAKVTLPTP